MADIHTYRLVGDVHDKGGVGPCQNKEQVFGIYKYLYIFVFFFCGWIQRESWAPSQAQARPLASANALPRKRTPSRAQARPLTCLVVCLLACLLVCLLVSLFVRYFALKSHELLLQMH